MKFISIPKCGNEFAINADLLLLNLDPEDASRLLRAMEACHGFLRRLVDRNLAGDRIGYIAFPSRYPFRVFGVNSTLQQALLESVPGDRWAELPEDFDPLKIGDSESSEQDVDCHQVLAYVDAVYLSALGRWNDNRFESEALTREFLESVALGAAPEDVPLIDPARLAKEAQAL